EEHLRVVGETLEEIGASEVRAVIALNKIDRLDGRAALAHLAERHEGAVPVSALSGEGIEELRARMVALAAEGAHGVLLRLAAGEQEPMRYLFNHAFNLERNYLDDGAVEVSASLRPADYARLVRDYPSIEILKGPEVDARQAH
ncbi:MAG: hypothetical protein ACYSU0_11130, partial [Planctomycetota bacterium]